MSAAKFKTENCVKWCWRNIKNFQVKYWTSSKNDTVLNLQFYKALFLKVFMDMYYSLSLLHSLSLLLSLSLVVLPLKPPNGFETVWETLQSSQMTVGNVCSAQLFHWSICKTISQGPHISFTVLFLLLLQFFCFIYFILCEAQTIINMKKR